MNKPNSCTIAKEDWKYLAKYLKYTCSGSGPAVFAFNVLKQGWCSDSQFEAMKGMLNRLEKRRLSHEVYNFLRISNRSKTRKELRGDTSDYGVHYNSCNEEMLGSGGGEY